jgi:Tfp pilus assembly PilM family ATPase
MKTALPFNFSRLMKRPGPIGLDIGARHVKAVQLAPAGRDGRRLAAAAAFPRARPNQPIDADEAARVAEVLDRQGFVGRNVILGLGPSQLMSSVLELPPRAPGVPIEQIARMELARVHGRDAAGFEFAQWEVPSPARAPQSTHVMAVACAHDSAGALLDAIESHGLVVRALDAESCALRRACAPLLAAQDGMIAVLDLGHAAARLLIVHRDAIVYTRAIADGGMARPIATLQGQLGAEEDAVIQLLREDSFGDGRGAGADSRGVINAHVDALLKEMDVAFAYATQQFSVPSVSGLLLVGGGADLPGVADRIGGALRVPVRVAAPGALIQAADAPRAAASASMTAALGLAMYREADQ